MQTQQRLRASKTTSGLIVENLRQAILRGRFKENEPIRQHELANELGVSVIPIREALFVLESEGLITFYPNRGAVVSSLSVQEVDEIYEMRIALESLALQRAMSNQRPSDLAQAKAVLTLLDEEAGDITRWSELNWEFHLALYKPANMPRLIETVRMLHHNVARYFVIYQELNYRTQSQAEHYSLVEACERKDSTTALACLQTHLRASAEALMSRLDKRSTS